MFLPRTLFVLYLRLPSLMLASQFRSLRSSSTFCSRIGGWRSMASRPLSPAFILTALLVSGFILSGLVLPGHSLAQPQPGSSPLEDQRTVQVDALADTVDLTIGSFIQTDLGYQASGPSGFDLRTARIRATADAGITRAVLQTDVVRSPSVLDARLEFRPGHKLQVTAGLFKSPLSRSHLTSRSVLPLVERPIAVDALAPRRQVGVSLRVHPRMGRARLTVGAFNGNGRTVEPNDNDLFLYVGRLEARAWDRDTEVELAINGAYSIDDRIALPGLSERFTGRRAVIGGDVSISRGRWEMIAEVLRTSLTPEDSLTRQVATGGYLLATFTLTDILDVAGRFEHYDSDRPNEGILQAASIGLNLRPNNVLRFQITGTVPIKQREPDRDDASVTMRAQFSFP